MAKLEGTPRTLTGKLMGVEILKICSGNGNELPLILNVPGRVDLTAGANAARCNRVVLLVNGDNGGEKKARER